MHFKSTFHLLCMYLVPLYVQALERVWDDFFQACYEIKITISYACTVNAPLPSLTLPNILVYKTLQVYIYWNVLTVNALLPSLILPNIL